MRPWQLCSLSEDCLQLPMDRGRQQLVSSQVVSSSVKGMITCDTYLVGFVGHLKQVPRVTHL